MALTCAKGALNVQLSLTNNMLNNALNGSSVVSAHIRCIYSAAAAASFSNRAFSSNIDGASTSGFIMGVNGSNFPYWSGRSRNTDTISSATSTTSVSVSSYYSFGVIINYSAKTCAIYVNGVLSNTVTGLSNLTQSTYTAGTATVADVFGGFPGGGPDQGWAGDVAEFCAYNANIGADNMSALGQRFISPLKVQPQNLVVYYPLISNGANLISGTLPTSGSATFNTNLHPRVYKG